MNCTIYKNVSDFLDSNEKSLLIAESEHNVILGFAESLNRDVEMPEGTLLLSVIRNSLPVGQAIRTHHDKPLAISKMDSEAARTLGEFLLEQRIPLKAFSGPIESSQSFANSWEQLTNRSPALSMHLGVYELDRVVFPSPDGRSLIPMSSVSRNISLEYVLGFLAECFPNEENPQGQAAEIADRHWKNDSLFFWKGVDDPQPVSMASNSRKSRNGATISLVYTPPQFRGMGHASRIVAALSDRCLNSGKKFCNLFTDLTNPTSNSIYQKIGYRKIGESKHFTLPQF